MTITIQKGSNYPKEQLIQPLTNLILAGFEAKFTHRFFTTDEAQTIAYALSVFLASEKANNLLIAEKNGKISGCLYFITKTDGSKLLQHYLQQSLPKNKRLKAWILLGFLSHQPKANERHIDFIAVSPVFRGLGIGGKLIQYCQDHCSESSLTLHVAKSNIGAYKLYQSKGFLVDKDLSSLIGRRMTGIDDWWYMRWESFS